jgi:hypothetical protein
MSCLASGVIGGSCLAQDTKGTTAPHGASATKQAAAPKHAARKTSAPAPKPGMVLNDKPTMSKISFQSRPSGVRIALSNGRSCVTPCSFIVGYNEKFTGVATKAGYARQELDVSPSVTQNGRAYIVGMAIGGGLIGLVAGAASAPRAYGPEPIVIEMVPSNGSGPPRMDPGMAFQSTGYTGGLSPQ